VFAYSSSLSPADAGFVVVTDRFLCLLGPEATAVLASHLYTLLDDGTDIDDVFAVIAARETLQRFAIIETLDLSTRSFQIAVQGEISVELEGATTTRLSRTTNATWISSEARDVVSLRLSLNPLSADDALLPIRGGVAVASTVVFQRAKPALAGKRLRTVPVDLRSAAASQPA